MIFFSLLLFEKMCIHLLGNTKNDIYNWFLWFLININYVSGTYIPSQIIVSVLPKMIQLNNIYNEFQDTRYMLRDIWYMIYDTWYMIQKYALETTY